MTSQRIYYTDSYLAQFSATVAGIDSERLRIRLGHTAFYPSSGGQPHDLGTLAGLSVRDVVESEDGGVVHILAAPASFAPGSTVDAQIDWARRFDHMQQHTGQHLLSAVFADVAQADTVSFHMGAEWSTIDLACTTLADGLMQRVEQEANSIVTQNRTVTVAFEDVRTVTGLRKATDRTGTLRVVTIEGLDRSACGGTHVRQTGEIGSILIRGAEKVRGNLRVEFVCGGRAIRASRSDYGHLLAAARQLGCSLVDVPRVVTGQVERLAAAEKQRSRLALDLASMRGRSLASAEALHIAEHPVLNEEVRAEAQAFTQAGGRVYLAWCKEPASLLLACHASANLHAGNVLKPLLAEAGGRGGGSAQMAQGSVPDSALLQTVIAKLQDCFNSAIVAPAPPSAGVAG